jgi:hypothetical protein
MSATPETDAAIKDQAKWRQVFVSTTLDGVTYDGPVAALCRRLEQERDKATADLNAANKALQYCSRALDQLESSNHSLSQALQTFVPLLDADITTMGRRELQRALKLLTPLEQQATRIREHLANDCKK